MAAREISTARELVKWKLMILIWLSIVTRTISAAELGCSNVKYAFSYKGFNGVTVPVQPVPGHHLRICQQGETCCTEEMEENFNVQSEQEFERIRKQTIEGLKHTFSVRATKFDEHFKDLLKKSKKDFHIMFVRTYGTIYEKNSYVFTDLFDNLEKYYIQGNINLEDALENFFLNLYQKMFQVINAQYSYNQKFLSCMQEFMDELKPFGDVPPKLTTQVRRAFVAVRTFHHGLIVGRDVVSNMIEVPPTSECSRALMKMTYCPHCQGLPDLKPCNKYCINVMKGCLAYHADLDAEWNIYIEKLLNLADRLEGPFNIESVVEPINIKISDAIMNFQENGLQVSTKIFDNCGKPPIAKRDVSRELNFDTVKFGRQDSSGQRSYSNLDKAVKDIRNKIKVVRNFWTNLPYQMCNNERIASEDVKTENDCWNGLTKAKYELQVTGDGVVNQKNNPEVNLDPKPNSLLNQQILNLKMISTKLKKAYDGMDVDWPDDFNDGSGSGSGDDSSADGSGDGTNSPEDSNEPYFPPTSSATTRPDIRQPTQNSGAAPQMKLEKAMNIFILPVMLMWLGSMF